ncbi:hypothetical protein ElyMa_002161800, partial [Elysia marginata]
TQGLDNLKPDKENIESKRNILEKKAPNMDNKEFIRSSCGDMNKKVTHKKNLYRHTILFGHAMVMARLKQQMSTGILNGKRSSGRQQEKIV